MLAIYPLYQTYFLLKKSQEDARFIFKIFLTNIYIPKYIFMQYINIIYINMYDYIIKTKKFIDYYGIMKGETK